MEGNEDEYLVIATKFEIVDSKSFTLKNGGGRILLYASIILPNNIYIDVFHTHLGLNANDHCLNIIEIMNIMNEYKIKNSNRLQILLGDFNTYLDYEYPMDILTLNYKNSDNNLLKKLLHLKCSNIDSNKMVNEYGPLKDAWDTIYGQKVDVMRTFTNFEDYRIEDFTRNDHIFYRHDKTEQETKQWNVCDVWIAGDESLNIDKKQTFPSDHRTVITQFYYN